MAKAAYGGRPTYGWHLKKLAQKTDGPITIGEILSHCSISETPWRIQGSKRGNYTLKQERHHRRSVERALHASGWRNVSRGSWQPAPPEPIETTTPDEYEDRLERMEAQFAKMLEKCRI